MERLSEKQKQVLGWWCDASPWRDMDAILCDGAVRSGKTTCLALSFFCWAMRRFDGAGFAICARSVSGARRNVVKPVASLLRQLGFQISEKVSRGEIWVRFNGHRNVFYLFGGCNEASGEAVQGLTLAGALLDEAALMPRSFVEQAWARCSAEGAKLWLSCNPEGPEHWLYKEWIQRAGERRLLRVHFAMEDNPALSKEVLERYERTFKGRFYRRFVLGEWMAAEGRVYDFFDESFVRPIPQGPFQRWRVSCDYGTVNPTSMGLWGEKDGVWYRVKEFYYDARKEGRSRTDREYLRDLKRLCGRRRIERVIVDPSAASFIAALREEGWPVRQADNDVLGGIRITAEALWEGEIVICEGCEDAIREFSLYRWDGRSGRDRVIKKDDHAMDEIRYFAAELRRRDGVMAGMSVERQGW